MKSKSPHILMHEFQELPKRAWAALGYRALARGERLAKAPEAESPQGVLTSHWTRANKVRSLLLETATTKLPLADSKQQLARHHAAVVDIYQSLPGGSPARCYFVGVAQATQWNHQACRTVLDTCESMAWCIEPAKVRNRARAICARLRFADFRVVRKRFESGNLTARSTVMPDELGELWPAPQQLDWERCCFTWEDDRPGDG